MTPAGGAITNVKANFYKDEAGEWRWRLVTQNGRTVAVAGEGFTREGDAHRSFASLADWAKVASANYKLT